MNCPKCGHPYSVVKDSRNTLEGKRRRRECSGCGFRFTVFEILESDLSKYKQMVKDAQNLKNQLERFCDEYKNN